MSESRGTREGSSPRLVVGVGASAGGLEAFKRLLSALPGDSGMTFLLVQHLDPTHRSLLPELLAPCTAMAVLEARHGAPLRPNTVYVIPPATALGVSGATIALSAPIVSRGIRLPVDHLFRSLAHEFGSDAAGIVLSGAGSDGSSGLRELKAAGGLTIAQAPDSSGQRGMPQSAVDTGAVDLILQISEMPEALERFANLPAEARAANSTPGGGARARDEDGTLTEQQLARLSSVFEADGSFDLRVYKAGTIQRRVRRRMGLSGVDEANAYLDHLQADAAERQALARDLLISVTEFFRDDDAFATLRRAAIDPLVERAAAGAVLRVWVAGCASGEEAYSLAIECLEAIERSRKRIALQIFATDVDHEALAIGRAGRYPAAVAERVSPERLQAFFQPLDGAGYQVRSRLRDTVSFAIHDITKDPPFSRMDLVSCRNVLIYLRPQAQQQVMRALHFALNPDGFLWLGPSESTSHRRDLFAQVEKQWRVYRKLGTSRTMPAGVHRTSQAARAEADEGHAQAPTPLVESGPELVRREVLQARVPPTIVVRDDGAVIFTHGELRPYLRFPEGDHPQLTLSSIVTPALATRTRAALYKCRKEGQTVVALSSQGDSAATQVRITATPAPALGEGTVILTFDHVAPEQPAGGLRLPADTSGQDTVIEQLERELQATREDLRHTVEELETSNEELRTSNEESMSVNEELQSANEELEATTEELRSLNEELTTVNAQLREKVELLEQARDDISNFFSSTKIATLFLDDRLCIKRFTPAAAELLRLDDGDAGRFIGDIARELLQGDFVSDARTVLEHLGAQSRELEARDGRWIVRRVLPYRTEARRIEGVVVTFVDVTDLKAATDRLAQRERQQAVIARLGLQALKDRPLEVFLDQVVREVQETLDTDFCKILELQPGPKLLMRAGVGWHPGLVRTAYVDMGPNSQAGFTLQRGDAVVVDDVSTERRFSGPSLLHDHGVVSGLSCPIRHGTGFYGVLGAHTKTRRAFSSEEIDFLQAVAGVVATAVGRHHTRARLALEACAAKALAEGAGLGEVLGRIVDCFCEEFGTTIAELWQPALDGEHLQCRAVWARPPHEEEDLQRRFCRQTFKRGSGLVGAVYERGRAIWISEVSDPSIFQRREAAKALGMVSGLGVPVVSGTRVLGVFTMFAPTHLQLDDILLKSLEGIGRAIGDYVERTELGEKARRLASITAASHDAIYTYDLDGMVTEWLQGAASLYGYPSEEMLGGPVARIVPGDKRDELETVTATIRRGDVLPPFDTERRTRSGRTVAVSVRSAPVTDAGGRIVGVSSTDRDISAQKDVERRLREADRQKDDFLAMLGHELRNPLAAIRSAASVLRLSGADETVLRRTQAVLERQTHHMSRLIDGLLDVSRIVRGKIALDKEPVDLRQICADLIADVRAREAGRQLLFTIDLSEAPVWVAGDRVRLAQVVDNLVSNAIKYTPDGGSITVTLAEREGTARLSIRDTGVGIEPELLPQLFQVFRQARQSLDRARGGLGLGLALVRALVDLHGGMVEARSDGVDAGSEFIVHLPTTAASEVLPKEPAPPVARLRVLVVEDNQDACEMLQFGLEIAGHDAHTASTGPEALALIREIQPDVVLCDLGLPGMSGYDVAEAVRNDGDARRIYLIALTGYGRPEDRRRCLEAGFDEHLTKPVDLEALAETMARVVRRQPA